MRSQFYSHDNTLSLDTHHTQKALAPLPELDALFLRYAGLSGDLACGVSALAGRRGPRLLSVSGNERLTGGVPACLLAVSGDISLFFFGGGRRSPI